MYIYRKSSRIYPTYGVLTVKWHTVRICSSLQQTYLHDPKVWHVQPVFTYVTLLGANEVVVRKLSCLCKA